MDYIVLRERDGHDIEPIYDVQLNQRKTDQVLDQDLIGVASTIVEEIKERNIRALTVFFWEEGQRPGKELAMAGVDWAPNGNWEERFDVKAGNYEDFTYTAVFNDFNKRGDG